MAQVHRFDERIRRQMSWYSTTASTSGTSTGYYVINTNTTASTCTEPHAWVTTNTACDRPWIINYTFEIPQQRTYESRADWTTPAPLTPRRVVDPITRQEEARQKMTVRAKSKQFLKEWLTEEEHKSLEKLHKVLIPSSLEEEIDYMIYENPRCEVERYANGVMTNYYCMLSQDDSFPEADKLLAKILMIKTNEREFLRLALRQ